MDDSHNPDYNFRIHKYPHTAQYFSLKYSLSFHSLEDLHHTWGCCKTKINMQCYESEKLAEHEVDSNFDHTNEAVPVLYKSSLEIHHTYTCLNTSYKDLFNIFSIIW